MSLPAVACAVCNSRLPLEVWIAHAATREAFEALARLHPSIRLPMTALRYVGLFAPAKQTMRWERIADLLVEVRELVSTGRVDWKHQSLAAPMDYWLAGMETLLAKAELRRPLANHNYLKAVVAGMSEQAAGGAEQRRIAGGRGETPTGGNLPSPPAPPPGGEGCAAAREREKKPKHNREAAAKALADITQKLKGAK